MANVLSAVLVLADSRLPAGSHAYSGGLEPAVAAGRVADLPTLEAFLRGRLATTGRTAAAFTAAACAGAACAGASCATGTGPGRLADLDAGLDARTPSPAARRASYAQGRALLRAGRALYSADRGPIQPGLPRFRAEHVHDRRHQAVALGLVAAAAGLVPEQAAAVAAYGSVSGPASAAVRLLGLDPFQVHALLARLAPPLDELAAAAGKSAHDPVPALPAAGAPLLDLSAEAHATWEVRLFAS